MWDSPMLFFFGQQTWTMTLHIESQVYFGGKVPYLLKAAFTLLSLSPVWPPPLS